MEQSMLVPVVDFLKGLADNSQDVYQQNLHIWVGNIIIAATVGFGYRYDMFISKFISDFEPFLRALPVCYFMIRSEYSYDNVDKVEGTVYKRKELVSIYTNFFRAVSIASSAIILFIAFALNNVKDFVVTVIFAKMVASCCMYGFLLCTAEGFFEKIQILVFIQLSSLNFIRKFKGIPSMKQVFQLILPLVGLCCFAFREGIFYGNIIKGTKDEPNRHVTVSGVANGCIMASLLKILYDISGETGLLFSAFLAYLGSVLYSAVI